MWLYGTRHLMSRVQAWELLEYGAKQQWGLAPLPPVERAEGGKPRFSDDPRHHFNLSHSGSFALCALDDRPVGVDIQIVKTTWRDKLPKRVCSETELAWLNAQPSRWDGFTLLWSMKESRVKQSGIGLRVPIPGISVPLPEKGQSLYQLENLWFRVYRESGWAACVCGEREPPEEIVWL